MTSPHKPGRMILVWFGVRVIDTTIVSSDDYVVADNPYLENDTYPTATFSGDIENNGFSDEYIFTAQAGELFIFDIEHQGAPGENNDTYLRIYNANGSLVISNDDNDHQAGINETGGVDSYDPYIKYIFDTDGTYTAEVRGYSDENTGSYVINISKIDSSLVVNTPPAVDGDFDGYVVEDAQDTPDIYDSTYTYGTISANDIDEDYVSIGFANNVITYPAESVTTTMEFSGGLFDIFDPSGVSIGSANDVVGMMSIDTVTGAGTASLSSVTPFFGQLWNAHDITVQMTGEDTMTVNMLFDWGTNIDIAVTVDMGVVFNADGTATFTTLDTDGDGIIGQPMDNGPFVGFTAAFSGVATTVATTDAVYYPDYYADVQQGEYGVMYLNDQPVILTDDTDIVELATDASTTIYPPIDPVPGYAWKDWYYELNNESDIVQSLNEGELVTDVFTIAVVDEHGATTYQDIVITIRGTAEGVVVENTPPVITGDTFVGEVTEDADTTLDINDATYAYGVVRAEDAEGDYISFALDDGTMYRETDYGTIFLPQIAYVQTDVVDDQAMIYIPQINLTGSFDMYDANGGYIGGASDVAGSLMAGSVTDSAGFTDNGTIQISSETPFFGNLWTAHDITYDFDVNTNMIHMDMLFDWSVSQDIPIEMSANVVFNADGTATITAVDGDYDGILGDAMLEGPFAGLTPVFNFELSSEDGSAITPDSFTFDPYIWWPYPDFIDWSYQLNNESDAVQALNTGDTIVETFTIVATDTKGATDEQQITVTIHGTDDGLITPPPVIDYPIAFSYETLSAKVASIEKYGADYSTTPNDTVIKLTLTADMANVIDTTINSITGAEIDLNIDWTQFEMLSYNDGSSQLFESINSIETPSVWQTYTDDASGNLNKLVVGSIDTAANPPKTLVDNVDSAGLGVTDRPSVLELGSIYLKPIAGLEAVDFSYSGLVITNEATSNYTQISTAMSIDTTLIDAIIYTADDMLLDNLNIHYIKDGIDTGVHTWVEQGGIKIDTSVEFDSIILSDNNAYQGDLNIIDMYGVLDNIAQDINTFAEHASDTDNDGTVNIIDMYSVLDGIGQGSQTFDLVDQNGNLVTSLNTSQTDIVNWTIVANGDVNLSGAFDEAYVMQVDVV